MTGAAVKPGEVPPTQDPRLTTHDQAGALYFARYFYQALDWSIATTNANLLRPISADTCTTCHDYIANLDALAASGGHSEGGRLVAFMFAPAYGDATKSDFVVQVTLNQDQNIIVNANGTRRTPAPTKNPATNYLYMDWVDGGFVAVEIGRGS